jgi:hypothetical protein
MKDSVDNEDVDRGGSGVWFGNRKGPRTIPLKSAASLDATIYYVQTAKHVL